MNPSRTLPSRSSMPEQPRAVPGRVLDHLERMEAGLLLQLELARDAEAVHRIDIAGIVAGRDQAALAAEIAQRVHPDAVLLLPARLLRARPAEEERAVVVERRPEERFERRMQIVLEPGHVLRAHARRGWRRRSRSVGLQRDAVRSTIRSTISLQLRRDRPARTARRRGRSAGSRSSSSCRAGSSGRRRAPRRRCRRSARSRSRRARCSPCAVVSSVPMCVAVRRPELVGLVHDRLELIAIHRDDLQAVGAALRRCRGSRRGFRPGVPLRPLLTTG